MGENWTDQSRGSEEGISRGLKEDINRDMIYSMMKDKNRNNRHICNYMFDCLNQESTFYVGNSFRGTKRSNIKNKISK